MQDTDYLFILSTVQELPFPVGRRTLIDIVSGAVTKKIVANDTYMDLQGYGSLSKHGAATVEAWVDKLIRANLLELFSPEDRPYWKLLRLTPQGLAELREPTLLEKSFSGSYDADEPSEESKTLMRQFAFFLEEYTPEQRHAIVCPAKRILCVAGAGSGKTTVLTQRIRFLCQFRGVTPKDVLAITFTRKARAEMEHRLRGMPVTVVTFNGFCERLLREHGRAKPVIGYGDKRRLFGKALKDEGLELHMLIKEYYTRGQRRNHTDEELARRLMGDVYGLIDHYANEDGDIPTSGESALATVLLKLARRTQALIRSKGMRTYSDQLTDVLVLLRERPELIPKYAHVLVDEYQDVNTAQHELLGLLAPDHLFLVGDPRQSIFGWRGSRIGYITDCDADVTVQLRTNFRSAPQIIEVMNAVIRPMGLPDLRAGVTKEGAVQVLSFDSEEQERSAVAALLRDMAAGRERDVFVLARTNRQLEELSAVLKRLGIAHTLRHEEDEGGASGIVLATVHAIKGLEAEAVIVMGAGNRHFPCKVSDHPVMDLIKDRGYDRDEEELRLLYVALSRAKRSLIITHSGTRSFFLDGALGEEKQRTIAPVRDDSAFARLKEWRARVAKEKGLPAYCICSDKSLREIADTRPQTTDELLDVHGMGPTKVSQYGEALLDALER